jgi:hypothetical protein
MTEQLEPKRKPESQTPEPIVERGLMAMGACNGNSRKAAALLAADGIKLHHTVLWSWARKIHIERYAEIRAQVLPQIRAQAADEHMDLAERMMEVNGLMVDRLKAEHERVPTKELPGGIRNLSVAGAVETEKAQLLNDQPTQRVATNMPGLLKELKDMGIEFVDGEVVGEEDVTEAELAA